MIFREELSMHHAAQLFFVLRRTAARSYWRTEHVRYDYPAPLQTRVPAFVPNAAELLLAAQNRCFKQAQL